VVRRRVSGRHSSRPTFFPHWPSAQDRLITDWMTSRVPLDLAASRPWTFPPLLPRCFPPLLEHSFATNQQLALS
jgi:hypothetical protein